MIKGYVGKIGIATGARGIGGEVLEETNQRRLLWLK